MSKNKGIRSIRGQDHMLAYITPGEAQSLKDMGGRETMTPEGIPAYPPEGNYGSEGKGQGSGPGESGISGMGVDGGDYVQSGGTGQTSGPDRSRISIEQQINHERAIRDKERARKDAYRKQQLKAARRLTNPNIFERFGDYTKKSNRNWAAKQKQKQKLAIDKYLEEVYGTTSPRMIDIKEVREQLMSQYDPSTNTMKGLEGFNTGKPGMNFGKTQLGPLGLRTTGAKGQPLGTKYLDQTPSLSSRIKLPGMLGKIQGKQSINNLMSSFNKINQLTDIQKDGVTQGEITDYYDRSMGRGKYDIFGRNGDGDGDNNQPFIPINYNTGAAEEQDDPYTNDFTYRFGNNQNVGADVTRGYAADGGIMGTRARRAFGGIMDRVTGRKAYGLGSIFKSVGKAVSGVAKAAGKVLKSDVGKAALFAAGAYYMGGGTGFGGAKMFGNTSSSTFMGNLGRLGTYAKKNPFKTIGFASTILPLLAGGAKPNEDIGMADRGGRLLDSKGNEALPSGLRAEVQEAYASGDSDKIKDIQKYYSFLPSPDLVNLPGTEMFSPYTNYGSQGYRTTAATGGRMAYAEGGDEGGLMDLGGMEKDYRNDGGFVPIGEYEKKDDVPARLSVNEFVFTADAVRGAGGGDIDKGAEIMENVMKNLEGGGQMSKESQGNTGAQDMFSVSQRLGEVL